MSGTTTGGGPSDVIVITDPKNGICRSIARGDLKAIHEGLPEGHPVRSIIEPMLPTDPKPGS
jgi:hypothetical protein